jgi:hypothetical protein
MIPNDQPLRQQTIRRMLEALIDREFLTKWESDFIQSIAEQFDKKGDLSDRQCEILERLYDKL